MEETEYCPTCGQKIAEYRVGITPMMVKTLVKFRMAILDHGKNKIHLLDDMNGKDYELTRHEWNNFTRLRFHALVAKEGESGYWVMTKRGADFLNGKQEIPKYVWIHNNRVKEHSDQLVNVRDVMSSSPYLEKLEDIVYRSFEPEQANLL